MIGEYSGTYFSHRTIKTFVEACSVEDEYSTNHLNAKEIGNATRFANFGFPNTLLLGATAKGMDRQFLVTGENLKKGEPILFSYGASAASKVYHRPHVLLGREKMREFFKPGLLTRINEGPQYEIQHVNYRSKMCYP